MEPQLSNKKKVLLVICTFLCVGVIGFVLKLYLSDWWFFLAMLGLLLFSHVVVWWEETRQKRKKGK